MIAASGFREYDARWPYPAGIDLEGMEVLGLSLGTQMHRHGVAPKIAVGSDYRSYSADVRAALISGLVRAGITVSDIGTSLSPMAYFAQFHLDVPAVAMVTASHNPNGWTGVKMGFDRPVTHGPDEMSELRDIVMGAQGIERPGGCVEVVENVRDAYLDDLIGDFRMTRPLKVVCATGNGTAGDFAPELLRRMGLRWCLCIPSSTGISRITTRTPKRWRCCTTWRGWCISLVPTLRLVLTGMEIAAEWSTRQGTRFLPIKSGSSWRATGLPAILALIWWWM